MKIHRGLLALALSLIVTPSLAAEYTLAVEPNYSPAQAQEIYKPLLEYLARETGHTFKLKTATNYHVYWRDLRSNAKTDFAFEEAHFTGYRIDRLGFTPLVRTAESTRYTLLADGTIADGGIAGLIGYRVVSMPAPSMGYLLLGELYKNPIAQPEIRSVAANWSDGVQMVFSQESEAAMVPSYIAQQYPNLVTVSESREFVGRALSAGGTVPADVRRAVTDAMLKLNEENGVAILTELGTGGFVTATSVEYASSEALLRGVFGYKPKSGGTAAVAAAPAANGSSAAAAEEDAEIEGGIEVTADE